LQLIKNNYIFLITLQGFPTARELWGILFTTTLPAPIVQLSPIITFGNTLTPPPNQTFEPTVIGFAYSKPLFLF